MSAAARCDVCQEEIDVKKLPKIELEGWVWLQSAKSAKSWSKRYFVLYGKHISIFAHKEIDDDGSLTAKGDWKKTIRVQLPTGVDVVIPASPTDSAASLVPRIASKLGAPVDISQFVLDELGVGVLPPSECPIVLQYKRESMIAWSMRSAYLTQPLYFSLAPLLRPIGAVHVHNVQFDAKKKLGKFIAPYASLYMQQGGSSAAIGLCFASETQRDVWMKAIVRASQRVPARFCAECCNLIDLALCSTTVKTGVVQHVESESPPTERFLVMAASHVALYSNPTAFGSAMALHIWHASCCSLSVVSPARFELRARRSMLHSSEIFILLSDDAMAWQSAFGKMQANESSADDQTTDDHDTLTDDGDDEPSASDSGASIQRTSDERISLDVDRTYLGLGIVGPIQSSSGRGSNLTAPSSGLLTSGNNGLDFSYVRLIELSNVIDKLNNTAADLPMTSLTIPPLVLPAIVIDVSHVPVGNSIGVNCLPTSMNLAGFAVLFYTGRSKYAADRSQYDTRTFLRLPLADALVQANVAMVGIDSGGVDISTRSATRRATRKSRRLGVIDDQTLQENANSTDDDPNSCRHRLLSNGIALLTDLGVGLVDVLSFGANSVFWLHAAPSSIPIEQSAPINVRPYAMLLNITKSVVSSRKQTSEGSSSAVLGRTMTMPIQRSQQAPESPTTRHHARTNTTAATSSSSTAAPSISSAASMPHGFAAANKSSKSSNNNNNSSNSSSSSTSNNNDKSNNAKPINSVSAGSTSSSSTPIPSTSTTPVGNNTNTNQQQQQQQRPTKNVSAVEVTSKPSTLPSKFSSSNSAPSFAAPAAPASTSSPSSNRTELQQQQQQQQQRSANPLNSLSSSSEPNATSLPPVAKYKVSDYDDDTLADEDVDDSSSSSTSSDSGSSNSDSSSSDKKKEDQPPTRTTNTTTLSPANSSSSVSSSTIAAAATTTPSKPTTTTTTSSTTTQRPVIPTPEHRMLSSSASNRTAPSTTSTSPPPPNISTTRSTTNLMLSPRSLAQSTPTPTSNVDTKPNAALTASSSSSSSPSSSTTTTTITATTPTKTTSNFATNEQQQQQPQQQTTTDSSATLPVVDNKEKWREAKTADGRTYYYRGSEVKWQLAPGDRRKTVNLSKVAPNKWKKAVTADGVAYWYNKGTNATSLTMPDGWTDDDAK